MKNIAKKLGKAFILLGGVLVSVVAAVGKVIYLMFDFIGEAFKTGANWLGVQGAALMEKGGCEPDDNNVKATTK